MKKIKMYLESKVSRKTMKNGIWMYLLQFFNTVIPLITLPYVTRILGTTKYGIFSSSFNIIGYLQVVVEYGFAMSATREVALNSKKSNLNKTFSSVLYSRFFLLFLCLLFSLIYTRMSYVDTVQLLSYWIMTISLLGITIQGNWIFQGLQDMKYIAIANIISRSITTILIFGFVKTYNDLLVYCFLYALSPVISNVIGLFVIVFKFKVKIIKISIHDILEELKRGWYIFTTQFTSNIFGAIGITFLTMFDSSSTVGIFSAIQKIPNALVLMWTPISTILYPIVSKKMKESFSYGIDFVLKVRRYMLIVIFCIIVILCIFSNQIIDIAFGNAYAKYSYWLIPLLFWLFLSIDNNFWGIQILLGSGHDKEYSICFMVSVIITIVFNFLFIKCWGGIGAALAPFASELLLDIFLILSVKKIKRNY